MEACSEEFMAARAEAKERASAPPAPTAFDTLTPRQLETAKLLAVGFDCRQIAEQPRELDGVVQSELAEHHAAVRVDGLDRDVELAIAAGVVPTP